MSTLDRRRADHGVGLSVGVLAVLLLAIAAPSRARVIEVLSNATGPEAGTFESAINEANDSLDTEDTIRFATDVGAILLGEPGELLTEDDELPVIFAGSGPDDRIDITAEDAPAARVGVDPDVEEPVPDDFEILHVGSGRVTVIELEISGGLFVIDQDAELGFRYEEEAEIEDDIVGDGRFFKEGPDLLVLSGENSYSGGTDVLEGRLRGDVLALQGDFEVGLDAVLDVRHEDEENAAPWRNVVRGEGRLAKSGAGSLEILDDVRTEGGLLIEAGRVRTKADFLEHEEEDDGMGNVIEEALLVDVEVASGATLELFRNAGDREDYAGAITGEGGLVKSGTQPLRLTGSNSFSGGILLVQELGTTNTLIGDTASLPGNIQLEAQTLVIFDEQSGSGTHVGNITGEGSLQKDGPGTVTLEGSNSYSGGTAINEGRLRGDARSLQGLINVAGGASIEFSHSDAQVLRAELSGDGTVVKSGPGRLVVGSQQFYTGDTEIQGGTLQLDVPLTTNAASSINVGPSGSLVSSASTASSLLVQGTLIPGGDVDQSFTVSGSATFAAGSALSVVVDDQERSSRLVVDGPSTTIQGGTVDVDVRPGLYDTEKRYTIIESSQGAIAGTGFTATSPNFAFLEIGLPQAPFGNTYQITIQLGDLDITRFARTPNQFSTALGLEEYFAVGAGNSDVTEVLASFGVLTAPEVPIVLDEVAGGTLAAFTDARLDNASYLNQAIARRFIATRFERNSKNAPSMLRSLKAAAQERPRAQQGLGVWVEPFGVFGSFSDLRNALPISSQVFGFVAGFDYRFGERFPLPRSEYVRLGLAGGYTAERVNSERDAMTGEGSTYQVAAYGSYEGARLHVGGALRYARSDLESRRTIAFGDIFRRANGEFGGHEGSAMVDAGYRFGHPKSLIIHPLVGFRYTHLTQEPFQERGAGSLSLGVSDFAIDSMVTRLAARFSRIFTLKGEYGMEPELRLGWTHEFGDIDRLITGRFYQVPGTTPWTTSGAVPDRDEFWVGAGYTMSIGRLPLIAAHYDAAIGSSRTSHFVSLGLLLRW